MASLLMGKYARYGWVLLLIPIVWLLVSAERSKTSEEAPQTLDPLVVSFDINYQVSGTGTVFLLWGIDGWNNVPERLRPPGTKLYQGKMYTPMTGDTGKFTVGLTVPIHSRIDYVFNITAQYNGAQVSVWDTNIGRDYLSVASANGSETITASSPGIAAEWPENNSLPAIILLALLITLFIAHKLAARLLPRAVGSQASTAYIQIFSIAVSLLLILLPLRVLTLGYKITSVSQLAVDVPNLLRAVANDVFLVIIMMLANLGLLWIFRRRPGVCRWVPRFFLALALIAVLFSVINVKALPLIGKPLNYQWIYYSGFLKSFDARHAIAANLNPVLIINTLAVFVLLPVISFLVERLVTPVFCFSKKRISILMVVLPALGYSAMLVSSDEPKWDRNKLENPLVFFVSSMINSRTVPLLLRMKTPVGPEEFQTIGERGDQHPAAMFTNDTGIRNVVIFVLESVSTRYLKTYGGEYSVTPHLDAFRHQSLLFRNIYAHAPATNKSMYSILASAYPWISYRSLTQESAVARIPTLMGELKTDGYKTAYFNSSDLRFQDADKFLEGRGFDLLQDYRSRECKQVKSVAGAKERDYLDSTNDQCTAEAFAEWLPTLANTDFFAIIWTNNTHYPYFVSGQIHDYGVYDVEFNVYLNALRESDEALGRVMQSLADEGLSESTLVVVVGDHGEAFGQHDQVVHALKIYDENLHVPLLLINPVIFSGGENDKVGGLIDLAPTVMHVLGLKQAEAWHGRSLLATEQTPRTYFFAIWSDRYFGYREGDIKFIYNASRGTTELYDLQTDPLEEHNIVTRHPDSIERGLNQLAAWVQFQDRYIKSITGQKIVE